MRNARTCSSRGWKAAGSFRQSPSVSPGSTPPINSTQLLVHPRSYDLQATVRAQGAYVHLPISSSFLFRLVQHAASRK